MADVLEITSLFFVRQNKDPLDLPSKRQRRTAHFQSIISAKTCWCAAWLRTTSAVKSVLLFSQEPQWNRDVAAFALKARVVYPISQRYRVSLESPSAVSPVSWRLLHLCVCVCVRAAASRRSLKPIPARAVQAPGPAQSGLRLLARWWLAEPREGRWWKQPVCVLRPLV